MQYFIKHLLRTANGWCGIQFSNQIKIGTAYSLHFSCPYKPIRRSSGRYKCGMIFDITHSQNKLDIFIDAWRFTNRLINNRVFQNLCHRMHGNLTFIQNGSDNALTRMSFLFTNSLMPSSESSRPNPEFFVPPNGRYSLVHVG